MENIADKIPQDSLPELSLDPSRASPGSSRRPLPGAAPEVIRLGATAQVWLPGVGFDSRLRAREDVSEEGWSILPGPSCPG